MLIYYCKHATNKGGSNEFAQFEEKENVVFDDARRPRLRLRTGRRPQSDLVARSPQGAVGVIADVVKKSFDARSMVADVGPIARSI